MSDQIQDNSVVANKTQKKWYVMYDFCMINDRED